MSQPTDTPSTPTNAQAAIMRYRNARSTIDVLVNDATRDLIAISTPYVSGPVYKFVARHVTDTIWQLSEDVISALEGDLEIEDVE